MKSGFENPGSPEAVRNGCRCAQTDNHYGKGRYGDGVIYGYYINLECPLHKPKHLRLVK